MSPKAGVHLRTVPLPLRLPIVLQEIILVRGKDEREEMERGKRGKVRGKKKTK